MIAVVLPTAGLDLQAAVHWLSINVGELLVQSPYSNWGGRGWRAKTVYRFDHQNGSTKKDFVVEFDSEEFALLFKLRWE